MTLEEGDRPAPRVCWQLPVIRDGLGTPQLPRHRERCACIAAVARAALGAVAFEEAWGWGGRSTLRRR
ncbi:MAG: hypothetical protein U0232_07825 [Thermomicrobiales bacterium]